MKVEIECTARCGDGDRIQSPFCVKKYGNSNESVEVIDNKHCAEMKMPPKKIPCHMSCTDTRWGYTAWGKVHFEDLVIFCVRTEDQSYLMILSAFQIFRFSERFGMVQRK